MPNLYKITTKGEPSKQGYTNGELTSLKYHDIFDYPLSLAEMIRWRASEKNFLDDESTFVDNRSGYYFIEGREAIVYKKILRKRISQRKLQIAKRASKILGRVPFVRGVLVTGSLAMENSDEEGDIDLMIITKTGRLWTTRLLVYLVCGIFGIKIRRAGVRSQRDLLCLNIWLDEGSLDWKGDRNIYTAHEIAQIIPLVNKGQTYEKFLFANKWILGFWPNAVKIQPTERKTYMRRGFIISFIEKVAFELQKKYMRSKISREVITKQKALFHPQDWSKVVLDRLNILS